MRIAQISPLWERVPPFRYGGTELIVKLHSIHPQALRLDPKIKEPSIYDQIMLAEVYQQADHFDIIHSHVGYSALSYCSFVKTPTVHTMHGIFTPDNEKIFQKFCWQPLISISEAQREPRLGLNSSIPSTTALTPPFIGFIPNQHNLHILPLSGEYLPKKDQSKRLK
jgi:hypothetical protein